MNKKTIIVIVVVIIIVMICIIVGNLFDVDGVRYNADGSVDIGEGFVSYGLYDENEQIINDASTIVFDDDTFRGFIKFQQNNAQRCMYGLILMENYQQIDYSVKGDKTSFYRFELEGKDDQWIPIDFEIKKDAYELEMLIVSEPDASYAAFHNDDGSLNWDNMFASKNICVQRFYFSGRERVKWNTITLLPYEYDNLVGFEVVDCENEIPTVISSERAGEKVRVIYGQDAYEAENVVVVAFCDWKQTLLSDDGNLLAFCPVSGENGYVDITLPRCDSNVPYQLFAFIEPNEFGMASQASFRIIIE